MKKILSLLLVMAMLLSVAPMTWAAEQAESEATAPVQYRSLVLNDSIAINFKISRAWLADNGFTKAEFLMDGKVAQTIEGMPAGTSELAVFPFTQLTPAQMGKDVTVKYYAGEEVLTEATTSVLSYCNDTLNDANESALLKTALVDMLNYGAAAQTYVGLADGETLVNADLGANAALGTPANKELTLTNRTHLHDFPNEQNSRSDEVQWLSAGLNLQDAVALRFKIEIAVTDNIDSVDDLYVKFYCNDFVRIVEEFVPVAGKDNQYYVYLDGLNPAQLREPIYATVYANTIVSSRLTYSVESYAADNASDPDALKAMTKALMVYGDSVTAWVKDAAAVNVGSDLTYIEAEDTQIATGIDGTFEHNSQGTMILTNNGTAVEWGSYGSYVGMTPNGNTVETLTNDLVKYPEHLSFDVKPATSGTYYVWALVSQRDGSNVYGYIDGSGKLDGWTYYGFNAKSTDKSDFKWMKIATCTWEAGETYGIRFRGRNSDWTVFDRFMITSSSVGGHDHTVAADWSTDATNHWHSCTFTGCTYTADKAAHSYGADGKCSCGKVNFYVVGNGDLTIEAENVDLFTGVDTTFYTQNAVTIVEDGSAVMMGVNNFVGGTGAQGGVPANYPAHLSFNVKVTEGSTYYIYARVKKGGNGSTALSLIEGHTGNTAQTWKYEKWNETADYTWVMIAECKWTDVNEEYTVALRARQHNPVIDKFVISTTKNATHFDHTFSADWATDETYHWHAATCGCNTVADKAAHDYTDDTDESCNTCGYIREIHVHAFEEAWTTNGTHHWHAATCGCADLTSEYGAHDFTTGICPTCGKIDFYTVTAAGGLYIAAEDMNLFEGKDSTYSNSVYPAIIVEDADAFGGKAVQLGNGTSGRGANGSNAVAHPAHISFKVKSTATQTFRIFVRAKECTTMGSNIFWCYNEEGTTGMNWTYFGTDKGESYEWYEATMNLEAGKTYTIGFRPRDQYIAIDEICISFNSYQIPAEKK